jgi:pseudouridine-5'-phosphate glycosidase
VNYKLTYSPEVQQAKANGDPIVALESTIISHGLPYPENVKMVEDVSAIIRQHGAVPATMAILGGEIRVGITPDELDHLPRPRGL